MEKKKVLQIILLRIIENGDPGDATDFLAVLSETISEEQAEAIVHTFAQLRVLNEFGVLEEIKELEKFKAEQAVAA